ncbi:MAG: ATP-binding protein [Chitinophagaceae bacterium]
MKKIVVIGPESTGKSTLCEQLAAHYNTFWCPEYAREYLLKHGTNYTFQDLLTIAKGQLELEEKFVEEVGKTESPGNGKSERPKVQRQENKRKKDSFNFENNSSGLSASRTSKLLFIDTDMYVMKVWCEFVFENCHRFILDQIIERQYDLYLFCNVDLPWVKDELREYPDLENRLKLYYIYKDIMINQNTPWVDISGNYEERLRKAITAVDRIVSRES